MPFRFICARITKRFVDQITFTTYIQLYNSLYCLCLPPSLLLTLPSAKTVPFQAVGRISCSVWMCDSFHIDRLLVWSENHLPKLTELAKCSTLPHSVVYTIRSFICEVAVNNERIYVDCVLYHGFLWCFSSVSNLNGAEFLCAETHLEWFLLHFVSVFFFFLSFCLSVWVCLCWRC